MMPAMSRHKIPESVVLTGLPGIEVRLKRSIRARRLSLRVGRADGAVTLTLPSDVGLGEALKFAQGHAAWIGAAVARVPSRQAVAAGGTLLFEGWALPVEAAQVRAPLLEGGVLRVPWRGPAGPRVRAWLRQAARIRLEAAVARHAAALGRVPGTIALRDPRARWGSCAADGRLMFSWRLVMAPPDVLDYVAAHEVAHLARMDHSAAFWAVVARLRPDHAVQSGWLRREGHRLHAWVFDAQA